MKILHTSDWHLGHSLHGLERSFEHAAFLSWLLTQIEQEAVDALLITGDVFDSATPPVAAERTFYEFLASARRRRRGLQVVVIGGNHDSPQRLEAARALLAPLQVHVVGRLPRTPEGDLDLGRLLIPLQLASARAGQVDELQVNEVTAWIAAVPFLRPADLPPGDGGPLLKAGDIYAQVLLAARGRRQVGQALIATAHCTLHGATLEGVSERTIHGGESLPADLFPRSVDYVAVGHVHKAQAIEREEIRYAGSPLPLSFAEVDYVHECRLLVFKTGTLIAQRALVVPRSVDLLRLPADGPGLLDEVLLELAALPPRVSGEVTAARPFLEVRVRCEGPSPGLRDQVEAALEGRRARLVKLEVERSPEPGESLADRRGGTHLRELDPSEVFRRCYAKAYPEDGDPPLELSEAFATLLSELRGGPGPETDLELARAARASAPTVLFERAKLEAALAEVDDDPAASKVASRPDAEEGSEAAARVGGPS